VETVRVLMGCSLGGEGHLIPLADVGRAIARAGHEVLVLVPPSLAAGADRTGLPYRIGDEPPRAFVDEVWERVRAGPPDAVAGLIDRELFAERCTQSMLPAARELRHDWQPDFVVREPCEYASAVVAHEAGIPHAQVGVSLAALEFDVLAMVAPIIDRFTSGLAAAIAAAPYLSAFPPSLDPSRWPDARRFRPRAAAGVSQPNVPSAEEPLVYMTFGTVLGHRPEAARVYRTALEAVAGLRARVLLTVGRAIDPSSLGPLPHNTRVGQWVHQDDALREAAAVICHGGSGTTFGALAAGLPVVICPLFADQFHNGRAVQDAGAGIVVGSTATPAGGLRVLVPDDAERLRRAAEAVLDQPAYRDAAVRIACEMASMPTLDDVVSRLLRQGAGTA
jgi:UDP:flavonoid glycosyltransferase YjiC (YdhE family)